MVVPSRAIPMPSPLASVETAPLGENRALTEPRRAIRTSDCPLVQAIVAAPERATAMTPSRSLSPEETVWRLVTLPFERRYSREPVPVQR